MRKYTYQEVYNIFSKKGYELITNDYKNADTKLIFKDTDGYYYTQTLNKFFNNKPQKFHISNTLTINNIKLYLQDNFPEYELLSDKYLGINSEFRNNKNTIDVKKNMQKIII